MVRHTDKETQAIKLAPAWWETKYSVAYAPLEVTIGISEVQFKY